MALSSGIEVPFTKQPVMVGFKFALSFAIPDSEDLFENENSTERDDWGTPLHGAAGNGHTKCVSFLLERSARRDIKNPNGLTPGKLVQGRENAECAALLVLLVDLTAICI